MARSLRPQQVGQRKLAIEVPHVQRCRNRGELVDHHLRPHLAKAIQDCRCIERIRGPRLRPEGVHHLRAARTLHHPNHIMSGAHQHWNQGPPYRTGCSRNEDLHGSQFSVRKSLPTVPENLCPARKLAGKALPPPWSLCRKRDTIGAAQSITAQGRVHPAGQGSLTLRTERPWRNSAHSVLQGPATSTR